MNLQQTLNAIEASNIYTAAIVFYGLYPLMTCFIYIVTAIIYYFRRPTRGKSLVDADLPFVSVLLPAYCEEDVIEHSIEGCHLVAKRLFSQRFSRTATDLARFHRKEFCESLRDARQPIPPAA